MAFTRLTLLVTVGQRAGLQHVHPPDDRVERRAQLMRCGGEEFVLEVTGFFGEPPRVFRLVERVGAFVKREVKFMQIDRRADPAA